MIDPYTFIRAVTVSLAVFWTVRGVVRTVRFLDRWERRFQALGLERAWLRRQALGVLARATFFDPANVALGCALIALWSV